MLAIPRGHAAPEALARHTADSLFAGVARLRVDHQMLGSLTPLDAGGVGMVTQLHDLRHYTDRSGISHPYEVWGGAEVLGFGSNSAFVFHRSIPATPDSYGVSWSPVAPGSIGQVAGRLRVLYTACPGANRENKIFVEPSTISVLLGEFTPNGVAAAPRVLATLGRYGSIQSNLAASFGSDALVFGGADVVDRAHPSSPCRTLARRRGGVQAKTGGSPRSIAKGAAGTTWRRRTPRRSRRSATRRPAGPDPGH